MPAPSRTEVEAAFKVYLETGAYQRRWNDWANLFTPDAYYYECQYGEFQGREAIRAWITKVMAGVPDMYFPPIYWSLIDGDQVVFCLDNAYPNPKDPSAAPIAFRTISYLKYAGNGLWSREEDYYDTAASVRAREAFRQLGGRATPPLKSPGSSD